MFPFLKSVKSGIEINEIMLFLQNDVYLVTKNRKISDLKHLIFACLGLPPPVGLHHIV
jgi:hypothetical protein